ncbi:MAG: hypothetical protein A2Z95_05655 [Gallionellales bacterium GWA2_60_18]|nr:MAG: hypothetical protein A2Z95_05655 [Gallionellales bacterium GWA2_60_18]
MSELQIALLAIGCAVVVVVYGYGWWQQRQYRRKFETSFRNSHADALYRGSADEPAIGMPPAQPQQETAGAVDEAMATPVTGEMERIEPVVASAPLLLDESCALLNAHSDFIIELHLQEAAPAAMLDGLWQRKFDFGKPVQVCGLSLNSGQWERAVAEGQTLYSRLRVALQLADRGGAASAAKLADFRDLVQGVANSIRADITVPDVQDAHRCAVELDAFCAEVDQMAGINLVPPGERLLTGARIAQAAALHGMALESDGAFHLPDAHGRGLLTLSNMDSRPFQRHTLETATTAGITLLLDVPRVEDPAAQFDVMLRIAREMAIELQLNLVDDQRVVLSDTGLARIREQIAGVAAKMSEHGIIPGSAQARRLFS